jgi:hypothetical protein
VEERGEENGRKWEKMQGENGEKMVSVHISDVADLKYELTPFSSRCSEP